MPPVLLPFSSTYGEKVTVRPQTRYYSPNNLRKAEGFILRTNAQTQVCEKVPHSLIFKDDPQGNANKNQGKGLEEWLKRFPPEHKDPNPTQHPQYRCSSVTPIAQKLGRQGQKLDD